MLPDDPILRAALQRRNCRWLTSAAIVAIVALSVRAAFYIAGVL